MAERPGLLGRALDLGCGRGRLASELAQRGWVTVGVDNAPRAIDAANQMGVPGATFVVGEVTALVPADLGTFDFFLDIGCFQGLTSRGAPRRRVRSATAVANPGATLLMLAFQPTKVRSLVRRVTQAEVEAAFPGWEMLSVEPAETAGLRWPLSRTAPQWYRMRRPG